MISKVDILKELYKCTVNAKNGSKSQNLRYRINRCWWENPDQILQLQEVCNTGCDPGHSQDRVKLMRYIHLMSRGIDSWAAARSWLKVAEDRLQPELPPQMPVKWAAVQLIWTWGPGSQEGEKNDSNTLAHFSPRRWWMQRGPGRTNCLKFRRPQAKRNPQQKKGMPVSSLPCLSKYSAHGGSDIQKSNIPCTKRDQCIIHIKCGNENAWAVLILMQMLKGCR